MKLLNILLILIMGSLTACLSSEEYAPEEIRALIDQELERRVSNFRETKIKNCQEDILELANAKVDSILFVESKLRNDSAFSLNKLPKPQKPAIRSVKDTRPIAPLFDSLQQIAVDTVNF